MLKQRFHNKIVLEWAISIVPPSKLCHITMINNYRLVDPTVTKLYLNEFPITLLLKLCFSYTKFRI